MGEIKYRKAEEMKDSGIEWLWKIPNEWRNSSLRQILREFIVDGPHETPEYVDVGIPFISVDSLDNNEMVNLDIVSRFISEKKYNEYNKKTKLNKNDILFSKSATIGKVAIVDARKYMTWSPLAIIKSDERKVFYKLLYYILSSNSYLHHVISLSNLNTQFNIGMKVLEKSRIVTPFDLIEQQKIANFLDIKTAQFDSIISKKELLIKKLKEAKKSLISEVVTGKVKIVDGEMVKRQPEEMKDSGVEWLGMIPKDWEVKKIKHVLKKGKDGIKIGPFGSSLKLSETSEKYIYKVYGQENLIKEDFSIGTRFINLSKFKQMKQYKLLENDIAISMMGTIGKSKVIPPNIREGIMDSHLIRLRVNENIVDVNLLSLLIKESWYIKEQLNIFSNGSIMSGLNSSIIKNLVITFPSLVNQKKFLEQLQNKINTFNKLINITKYQINKIKQAKQSLISEAVTGKIDLRDWEIIEEGEIQ